MRIAKQKSQSKETIIKRLNALYGEKDFTSLLKESNHFLEIYPEDIDILNLNGAACKFLGLKSEAVSAFEKVCKLTPGNSDSFINLGISLQDLGNNQKAIECFKEAIKIDPKNVNGHFNIANIYREQRLHVKAILGYKRALSINPQYPEVFNNLGIALKENKKLADAEDMLKKAISLNPKYAEAYNNLGNVLKDQGRLSAAINAFQKALELNKYYAEAYNNYGLVLKRQNSIKQAIQAYDAAIQIKPDYAEAYNNKGLALKKINKYDEAEDSYRRALSLNIEYAEAQRNLADILNIKNEKQKALEAYDQALRIRPDYQLVIAERMALYAQLCQWDLLEKEKKIIPQLGVKDEAVPLFSLLSLDDNQSRQLRRAKEYASVSLAEKNITLHSSGLVKSKNIRIGYFSSDFREHPVGYLLARIIKEHNRNEFDIFGYDLSGDDGSQIHKNYRNSFDKFIDLSTIDDASAISLTRDDKIDIAINLNGYTNGSRTEIFAKRIAPIQINYLGYPGTMGLKSMDYIVSDKVVVPIRDQKYFSESQIYMPFTYMPTDNTREISAKKITKKDVGLPDNSFVICCFNNSYKINRQDFQIWLRCMQKVQNSILWLRKSHTICNNNLILEAQKFGIEPFRLVLADKMPMDEHLARHKLADVFVDTSPFNAHTTAVDALWSGLPVITKPGKSFASRVAASLLLSLDLPELIAKNDIEYEALLVDLAQNSERLENIKGKLKENIMSQPLFMSEKYTRYLEHGYKIAYANYLEGRRPQTIHVPL